MLGKEAALFVPSGTMSNQLCLRTLTRMGDEVIVHEDAHVLHYEGGSAAALSGLQLASRAGRSGVLAAAARGGGHPAARRALRAHRGRGDGEHPQPLRRHRLAARGDGGRGRGGPGARPRSPPGRRPPLERPQGHRGAAARPMRPRPTPCRCASPRGWGLPVGSVLAGTREFVEEARNNRKRYGGAMRQAGIIAAGALYALEHNLDRLVEDHENAAVLAGLSSGGARGGARPSRADQHPHRRGRRPGRGRGQGRRRARRARASLCGVAAPDRVRFVTHLDVSAAAVKRAGEIIVRVLAVPGRGGQVRASQRLGGSDVDRERPCSWCESG